MASFVTLKNGKIKAVVRRKELNGGAITKTFPKGAKIDAEKWARGVESNLDETGSSHYHDLREVKVGGILQAYRDEQAPNLKDWRGTASRINRLLAQSVDKLGNVTRRTDIRPEPFTFLNLTQDVPAALREFRDKSIKPKNEGGYGHEPGTVNRTLGVISQAFAWAIEERGLKTTNPVAQVKKCEGANVRRDRLWDEDDLNVYLKAAGFDPNTFPLTQTARFPWVLLLQSLTGFRRSQACTIQNQTPEQARLRKEPHWRGYIDLSVPEIFFPGTHYINGRKVGGTKNDDGWHAPLTDEAADVIRAYMHHFPTAEKQDYTMPPPTLFGIAPEAHGTYWGRLRAKVVAEHPELAGLVPHEMRHTWTTALVEGFVDEKGEVGAADQITLLAMTGRRSVASLKHYFHPKVKPMANRMNKVIPKKGVLAKFGAPQPVRQVANGKLHRVK